MAVILVSAKAKGPFISKFIVPTVTVLMGWPFKSLLFVK